MEMTRENKNNTGINLVLGAIFGLAFLAFFGLFVRDNHRQIERKSKEVRSYGATILLVEICDGIDNNGDSHIDEGYDLKSDRNNCGACGLKCELGHHCWKGGCIVTQNEVCDNIDNNGDGKVDEPFDFLTDPRNCGGCGRVCASAQFCHNGHCEEKRWSEPPPAVKSCDFVSTRPVNLLNDATRHDAPATSVNTAKTASVPGAMFQRSVSFWGGLRSATASTTTVTAESTRRLTF